MAFSSVPNGDQLTAEHITALSKIWNDSMADTSDFFRYAPVFPDRWDSVLYAKDTFKYDFNIDTLKFTKPSTGKTTPTLSIRAEGTDMSNKIARNFYIYAVVNKKTDETDVQYVVASDTTEARDEIVQSRLGEGIKSKDVDIVLITQQALTPRTEKA